MFHGPLEGEANRTTTDLTRKEIGVLAPIVVLIVAIGLYPKPLFDVVEPSVDRVLTEVGVITADGLATSADPDDDLADELGAPAGATGPSTDE